MRRDFKNSIYNSPGDINQDDFLNLVFGILKFLFFVLNKFFISPHSVSPFFESITNSRYKLNLFI